MPRLLPGRIVLSPRAHRSFSIHLSRFFKLHAKMVNYHDPVTVAREFGAYASLSGLRGLHLDLTVCLFNSGAREGLAFRGWCICVSLSYFRASH
jgi:hypothetical protein